MQHVGQLQHQALPSMQKQAQQQQEQQRDRQQQLAHASPQLKRAKRPGDTGTTFLDVLRAGDGELALKIMRCFPSGDYFKDREFAACFALYSTCRAVRTCPAINQNISTLRWWLDNSGSKNSNKSGRRNNEQQEEQDSCGDDNGGGGGGGKRNNNSKRDGQPRGGKLQHNDDTRSGSSGGGGGNMSTDANSTDANNRKHEPLLAPHQRWPRHAPPVKVMHIGTTYGTVIGVQEQRELQLGLCTMVRAEVSTSGALRNLHTLRLSVSGMMWDDLMAGLLWANLARTIRVLEMWSDERCLATAGFIQHLALLPHLTSLDLDEQVVIEEINKYHGPMPPVIMQEVQQQRGRGTQDAHRREAAQEQEPSRRQHPAQQQQLQEMGPEEQQQLQRQQEQEGEEQDEAAKDDKYQCGVPPGLLSHLYQLVDLKVCLHARPGCLQQLAGLTNLETLTLQGVLSTDGVVHLDALTSLTKLREVTISPWMESVHETPWEGQQQMHVDALAHLPKLTRLAFEGWVDSCWDMVVHGLDRVAHPFNKLQQFAASGPIRLVESCGALWWPALQDVEIDGEVPLATMAKLTQHLPVQHVERLLGRSLMG